jgi:hypothetical protein
MPMALQTQRNGKVKISEENPWSVVSNTTKGRETETDLRHAYVATLEKLGFKGEKGKLKEWMTVARDRSAWGQRVEFSLDLPPGSFTNLRRH